MSSSKKTNIKPKAPESPAHRKPPVARGKKVLFILGSMVLIPLLVLGVLEGFLRVFGFGYPTSFLVKQEVNRTTYLVDNDKFGWRFFPKELARSPATLKF